MDNKEAIKFAKNYVADIFHDERIKDIGLEGISRDDDIWEILIGFDRPITSGRSINEMIDDTANGRVHRPVRRVYKRVFVRDADGVVNEMLPVE